MTSPDRPGIGIGLIGYAFMGAAHSQAWRTAPHFFDLPLRPELTVLAGRNAAAVADAAGRLGWSSTETDWRRVIERDDIDLVDVCTPGDTHAEIAIAALEAGKHVLCEKPLANTVAEAEAMAEAAARAAAKGVRSMVGLHLPPGAGDRASPASWSPRAGSAQIRHVRAQYLQDWIADPAAPHVVAAGEGEGRLGCARRHRRAHRRPDAVHHRRAADRGQRDARDLREGAAAARRGRVAVGRPRRRGRGR